ncbi:YncE family protein [Pseudonocardia benzenivorans]|uniref:YncE family protein n=1 Tax=Pseudonocardia benzenivorans TaxID=228005 RepID=A0ABW3VGN6_9PSEU
MTTPSIRRGVRRRVSCVVVLVAVLVAVACTGRPDGGHTLSVHAPGALVLSPDGATAYVTDQTDGLVRAVETATGREHLPVDAPFTDSLTIDHHGGRLFAFSRAAGAVAVIDPVQMTVAERISAQDPVAVAVAPDDTRAYVASSRGGTVTVVDMASGAAVDRPVGALPSDVVAAGRHVYVALAASRTIAVLTPDGVVTGTVRLPTSAVTEEDPVRLGVTPDETTLLTLDPVRGELYLVDPSTSTLLATLGAAAGASMLRMSADGRRAYVVATTTHEVAEIDVAARAQVATVPVGCTPGAIAEAPDGSALLATCTDQDEVSVVPR